MSDINSFSHDEYKLILKMIKSKLPILDYSEIDVSTESFCVIRHDIEFSIERAYALALIEHDLGISSSFFIQLNNNNYNPLSNENVSILKEISSMGHNLGLHYQALSTSTLDIVSDINFNVSVMNYYFDTKIDRFSFHRPNLTPEILEKNIEINGLINVYGNLFFSYFKGKIPKKLKLNTFQILIISGDMAIPLMQLNKVTLKFIS